MLGVRGLEPDRFSGRLQSAGCAHDLLVFFGLRVSHALEGDKEGSPMHGSNGEVLSGGELAVALSNLVVRLTSEYTGRGPTMARTHMSEDVISVVLKDTLTKGEQRLVRDGKRELVLTTRIAFQDTMRTELIAGVEALTGISVLAFLSANHIDPDIAVETFILDKPRPRLMPQDTPHGHDEGLR